MNALLILLIILIVLMLAVARKDGLRNLFGLFLNFIMIFILITMLSRGLTIWLILPLMTFIILAISIFLSSGEEEVANTAFKASLIVVVFLIIFAVFIQFLGQFQGFSAEDVDELENLSINIGLNFSHIAIAMLTISMLGAVAEASMAIIANLKEVIEQDEKMTLEQFQAQRMILSQQILGTAVNTLFFGTLGSSLGLILWFVTLKYTWAEIFNSKLLMMDVASMLLGMFGILLVISLAGFMVERDFAKKLRSH